MYVPASFSSNPINSYSSSEVTKGLQGILDMAYKSAPKGTPVGCTLAILQNGNNPLQKPEILHSQELPLKAVQHWGSVSKQFTAACIAKLVAQNKLHWDTDVAKILELPQFILGQGHERTVTVDQLLHMRSGLPEMTTLAALIGKDDLLLSLEEKRMLLAKYPYLEFEPGEKESYCNTNYYLLAAIVEKQSGKQFSDFVRDEVFYPLDMGCRCSIDSKCPPSIDGYTPNLQIAKLDCQAVGATGIVGSAQDMANWNAAIHKKEWDDLLVPPLGVKIEDNHPVYARGLNVTWDGDYRVIHHSGAVGPFVTQFMRYEHLHDTSKSFAFFLASNDNNILLSEKMAQEIAITLAKSPLAQFNLPSPPQPPKSIPINQKATNAYVGNYESHDLNAKYEIKAQEEMGTWSLHLYFMDKENSRKVTFFIPTALNVFSGPIGDTLTLTEGGILLTGARIAPLQLTRID